MSMKKIYSMAISLAVFLSLVFSGVFSGCSMRGEVKAPTENTFRFKIDAKIPTLDPLDATDVYSVTTQYLFLETLFAYHYLKRPYTLVPLLAEEMPVFSKDKKTLTIKLKKGIHFHDNPCFTSTGGKGKEFTSDDVVYFFERIASPKKVRVNYGTFEGRIVGIDEYHQQKADRISGVQALDPYTVQISLVKPWPRIVYSLSDAVSSMLSRECTENLERKDLVSRTPVGTGAYVLESADLNSKIVAVRNKNYKHVVYPIDASPDILGANPDILADAGKPLPFIDKVVFEIIPEVQPGWLKFMAGELDIAPIPKDELPSVIKDGKLVREDLIKRGVKVYRNFSGDVTLHVFNLTDSVWGKKKELRQAFALALDVPKIIEMQYSGQAIRAESIIDPTMYGYDPKFVSKWSKRDVKKAKELLAKAGYPDGKGLPPLVTLTGSDTTARQLDELMSRQLAEAGIVLKGEPMTWPEMMRRKQEGTFLSYGVGMVSSIPDFDDTTGLLHSKGIKLNANYARFSNAEVDRLIDEIEVMEDSPARLAKIGRIREILDDEMPYVPVVHRIGNQPVQPWVKNHAYSPSMFMGRTIKFKKIETRK